MEKITDITVRGTRAAVFVDGEMRGYLRRSTLRELGWQTGDEFDLSAWQEAMQGPEFRAALEEGARYLASARSRREVIRKLLSRGYDEQVCLQAADRLESYGYIRDEELARRAVESYAARGEGRLRIRQRLSHRGLDREISEEALEDYSEEQERVRALETACKLASRYAPQDRHKLSAALQRRGFSWDAVAYALRNLPEE